MRTRNLTAAASIAITLSLLWPSGRLLAGTDVPELFGLSPEAVTPTVRFPAAGLTLAIEGPAGSVSSVSPFRISYRLENTTATNLVLDGTTHPLFDAQSYEIRRVTATGLQTAVTPHLEDDRDPENVPLPARSAITGNTSIDLSDGVEPGIYQIVAIVPVYTIDDPTKTPTYRGFARSNVETISITGSPSSEPRVLARSCQACAASLVIPGNRPIIAATGFKLSLDAPQIVPSSESPLPITLRLENGTVNNVELSGGLHRFPTPYAYDVRRISGPDAGQQIPRYAPRRRSETVELPAGYSVQGTTDLHELYDLDPGTYRISATLDISAAFPNAGPASHAYVWSNAATFVVR